MGKKNAAGSQQAVVHLAKNYLYLQDANHSGGKEKAERERNNGDTALDMGMKVY